MESSLKQELSTLNMDRNLVYIKTPLGEEATRQRALVVQRNLRMVLLQVDGQLNVAGLVEKIGNEALVFAALLELEQGGYISISGQPRPIAEPIRPKPKPVSASPGFALSEAEELDDSVAFSTSSEFSSFDDPVMPVFTEQAKTKTKKQESSPQASAEVPKPGLGERLSAWLASRRSAPPADLPPIRRTSWGKRIAIGVISLVLLVLGGLLFFPYDAYRSSIESALSDACGVPVKVGSVGAHYLPRPALELRDVQLGANGEARLGVVLLPQLLALAGSGKKELGNLAVSDVTVSLEYLATLSRMLDGVRKSQQFSVERLRLSNVVVSMGAASLSGLAGELNFETGKEGAPLSLSNTDRSLRLEFVPTGAGTAVNVEASGWKPVEKSSLEFSSIAMKGLVQSGKVVLQSAEVGFADGRFIGSWLFDWSKGLSMSGEGQISGVNTRRLASMFSVPLEMDGWLSGNLHLRGTGENWAAMWGAFEANMSAQVERGVISGFDLGEAIRRGGQPVRGGMTKFDRLKANVRATAQKMTSQDVEIESGMLRSGGQFEVSNDYTFDANFLVNLESSVAPIRSSVRVTGKLPTLQAVAVR